MGLVITSKGSSKEYSFGYSGLHQLRWVAYKICGGEKSFGDAMSMQEGVLHSEQFEFPKLDSICKLKEPHYDWSFFEALQKFPNLLWHRDDGGSYNLTGKPAALDEDPLTGNSKGLLEELRTLDKLGGKWKGKVRWDEIFPQLYALVKEVVEEGDGALSFG